MSKPTPPALDRARTKAYRRLLPLLFLCYMIAYVDRNNVAFASLTMTKEIPGFDDGVIGFGSGIFFIGYFLLEIPGSLIVERWSARKWISRIMITWGLMAALTAAVRTPWQFYGVRFLLGLAEAGFYPGVIIYLSHWFPSRDRARALAAFFIATPIAQMVSPPISNLLGKVGTGGAAPVLGMRGWQWIYVGWGIPAVALGFVVLASLTDRPGQARWLDAEEREALEAELAREKAARRAGGHMTLAEALSNPKVLILAAAYFFIVTGNYGVEFFLPRILESQYHLSTDLVAKLVWLPPLGSLIGQIAVGWSSDRTGERRLHAAVPIYIGSAALLATVVSAQPPLWAMLALLVVASVGFKAYLPAFWSLPSLFLTEAAAAGSIGLINSVGNLGGFLGPNIMGQVKLATGTFRGGLLVLGISMSVSATIIVLLGLGKRATPASR